MAIRFREIKKHWEVYWRDPISQKIKTKTFHTQKEAVSFNKQISGALELQKKKARQIKKTAYQDKSTPIAVEVCYTFEEFKTKCQKIASDHSVTPADLFDFIMRQLELPTRYQDIVRTISARPKRKTISVKMRMDVLTRDNFRCQLCGATAKEAKLHVDHIIPVSKGGLTELNNLQTLCESCNLGKSDRHIFKPVSV